MRTYAATLAAVALTGAAGFVATGCGAEEAAGVDVAHAAEATAAKKTAVVNMTLHGEGLGLPIPIDLKATGVTALDKTAGTLTMDLGSILKLTGVSVTDSKLGMKFGGKDLYIKPPKVQGFTVPGGKQWVSVDLEKTAKAFGLDTKGLGALLTVDPGTQLKALNAAKGLKEVGKEDVGGTETTHFRGTYTIADTIAQLPADQRAAAQKAIKDLNKLAGQDVDQKTPADMWVDKDGVVRKMRTTAKVPAQKGMPAGSFRVDYVLSDFGAKLDTTPPAASDTLDVTDKLTEAAKQLSGSLVTGGGTGATQNG